MSRYDLHTALIVVDVQNDFADPAGSLSVPGGDARSCRPSTRRSRPRDAAGALVVATQDWHPESTPHFAKDGGIWPVHCVAGTWGAELHPDLAIARGRAAGPQGRQRRGRLLRLHHPRPDRPATTQPTAMDGLLRAAPSTASSWSAWPRTTASRRPRSMPSRLGLRDDGRCATPSRAVDVTPGDGTGRIDEMAEAGVTILDD